MSDEPYAPERDDAEEGEFALVIYSGGQALYRYEEPTPWEDLDWELKREYNHGAVPPLNLQGATVEQEADNGNLRVVTIYATDISLNGEVGKNTSDGTDDANAGAGDQRDRVSTDGGYVVKLSDDKRVPEERSHRTQQDNMGAIVDYLIETHNLIDRIEIPYYPPGSYKNCLINNKPEHENGDDMRGAYELVSEHYLYTSLNKRQKKDYIKTLADECQLEVDFHGGW